MTRTMKGKKYSHKVKAPGLQTTMAILMPKRTDNEVYLNEEIDVTDLLAYLEKKNEGRDKAHRIKLFHCVVMGVTKMVMERPQMNYYIKTCRVYEREEISMSFVVKREFKDGADEELMFYVPKPEQTIEDISRDIIGDVDRVRKAKHNSGGATSLLDGFAALPRPIQLIFGALIRFLDYWQISPRFLTDGDPNFSTCLMSNLGSIKCPAVYHHVNNYGTCSFLLTIGVIHKEKRLMEDGTEQIRDMINIGATLDERIADGFYFARSLKLVKYLFANPELLDKPLSEPSGMKY